MTKITIGNIELRADGYDIGTGAASRRRRGAADEPPGSLDALLRAADFNLAADFELSPAADDGRRAGAGPSLVELDVPVGVDEAAVVLVSDASGLLAWQLPDEAPRQVRRGASLDMLHFTIAPAGARLERPGRRGIIGSAIKIILEPVRVRVLRFLISHALDAAVARLEGDCPAGPVVVRAGMPVEQWTPAPVRFVPPEDRAPRILLLVHGTFSSTAGSFGALAGTPMFEGWCRDYDLVLGHDHKTLGEDPHANAQAIMATLHALDLPAGTEIDAIAYSRGGLVYRTLAEAVAPRVAPALNFRRAVFVGCTNGGTLLAEPANWKDLADVYTNVLLGAANIGGAVLGGGLATPWIRYAITTLGKFVQLLPQMAISERRLPGLAAMEPDGDVVAALNGAAPAAGFATRYFAVTSDFEPGQSDGLPARAAKLLADRIADRLLGEENDLVVHTRSMTDFGNDRAAEDSVALGIDQHVFHTVYFASPKAMAPLANWLGYPPATLAPSPRSEAGDGTRSGRSGRRGRSGFGNDEYTASMPANPVLFDSAAGYAPPGTAGWASAEPPVEMPPPELVERYIAAEMDSAPTLAKIANVYVTVSPEAIAVGDHAAAAALAEPAAIEAAKPLTITAMPRSNCEIVGQASCDVDASGLGDVIVKFRVRGLAAGAAELLVEARQGMRTVGSFLLAPTFVDPATPLRAVQVMGDTGAADPGSAVLRIYEFKSSEAITLRFDLVSENPEMSQLFDARLPHDFDMARYAAETLKSVEDAWGDGSDRVYAGFLRRIAAAAKVSTAELVPEKIRRALWANRKQIEVIQVISQEAYIPWELLYLFDPDANETDGECFLAEKGLIRWLHGAPMRSRPPRLDGALSRYVVPDYIESGLNLDGAAQERGMLRARLPGIQELPAHSLDVCDYLGSRADCAILHFACHGEAGQKSVLDAALLMAGDQGASGPVRDTLTWQSVKATADFAPGRGPLVFINACQTGRTGASIAGTAGFADAFIRPLSGRGASGFIGALWSVDDMLATTFADTLYARLAAGDTLPAAACEARKACIDRNDFTWLAYTVYAPL